MNSQIRAILEHYTDLPFTEDSKLIDDLGLDSFLIVYFITEIEECFGIYINESEFVDIITIKDLLDFIKFRQSV